MRGMEKQKREKVKEKKEDGYKVEEEKGEYFSIILPQTCCFSS